MYENPILAYYTDCQNQIDPELYNADCPGHIRVLDKRLTPTEEHRAKYYTIFINFIKEGIGIRKCGRIYLAETPKIAATFHIPQVVYLNAETKQCCRLTEGRWWMIDYRKVQAVALFAADSSLYDDLLHVAPGDVSHQVTIKEFVEEAKLSPEICVLGVINRSYGNEEIDPAIVADLA